MENNIFQPDRFLKLVVRQFKLNPKLWINSLILFIGFPILFFLINISNIGGVVISVSNRTSFLESLLVILFVLAPFLLFFNYNHPRKGLTEVMLPASIAEKYIVMQLICIFFVPLITIAIYGGIDFVLALIFPKIYPGLVIQQLFKNSIDANILFFLFFLQQAMMFFNLLFLRRKVLKTVVVFIISMIILASIMVILVYFVTTNALFDTVGSSYNHFDITDRGIFRFYVSDHPVITMMQIARILFQIVIPLAFMTGSYFLMKKRRY